MPSAITNDVVELAMVGRLYQALSDCAVLRTRLEAANAEIDRRNNEIAMLKRDLAALKDEREQ